MYTSNSKQRSHHLLTLTNLHSRHSGTSWQKLSSNTQASCYSTGSHGRHRCHRLANKVDNIDHKQHWACLNITGAELAPSLKTRFLGYPRFHNQTESWSVHPFLQGSCSWSTDRHTSKPRYMCNDRPRLMLCIMMRPNNISKEVIPSVLWRCWLGGRKGIWPVKNRVVGWWHGYESRARCWLAYGPADATASLSLASLASLHRSEKKTRSVYLSGTGLCLQCFDAVGWATGRASGL